MSVIDIQPRYAVIKPIHKIFFSHRVLQNWNHLSQEVIEADTINTFKSRLENSTRFETNLVRLACLSHSWAMCLKSFSDVANWHQSQKVEHGCTTTYFPLSNGIKIVSVLQRLHGEIWRTNSDVQKRDEQTNRQTKKLSQRFWPPRRWVKSEPHQTWHGDRGPRARIHTFSFISAPVQLSLLRCILLRFCVGLTVYCV